MIDPPAAYAPGLLIQRLNKQPIIIHYRLWSAAFIVGYFIYYFEFNNNKESSLNRGWKQTRVEGRLVSARQWEGGGTLMGLGNVERIRERELASGRVDTQIGRAVSMSLETEEPTSSFTNCKRDCER